MMDMNYNYFLLESNNNIRPKNKLEKELVAYIEVYHRTVLQFEYKFKFIAFIQNKVAALNKAHPKCRAISVSIGTPAHNNDVIFHFGLAAKDSFLSLYLNAFSLKENTYLLMLKHPKSSTSEIK